MYLIEATVSQLLEKLQYWPKVFFNFRKIIRRDEPCNLSIDIQTDPRLRLLKFVSQTDARASRARITANLLIAATHVSYMKLSNTGFLPDFPDTMEELVSEYVFYLTLVILVLYLIEIPISSSRNSVLGPEHTEFVNGLFRHVDAGRNGGLAGLRAPLHYALGISPLLLLVDKQLSKRGVDRDRILQVSNYPLVTYRTD